MGYWEYTQRFGRKFAKKSTRKLSEELGASNDTIYIARLRHLGDHTEIVDLSN